jgi:chemosensory pili system protein ChpE
MIQIFISAFLLGLVFNAAPGAVFAGSLVGDATWAILGLLGVGLLFQVPSIRVPLSIVGASYLIYLGYQSLRAATVQTSTDTVSSTSPELVQKGALVTGVSMSLTNPANVIYWGALGSVFGTFGISNPTRVDYGVFFAGFMSSSFIWCFVCAGLIHLMHKSMSPRIAAVLNFLCAVSLLFLGGQSLLRLMS